MKHYPFLARSLHIILIEMVVRELCILKKDNSHDKNSPEPVLALIMVQFAAEKCSQNQKITQFKDKYLKTVLDNYFTLN